MPEVTWNYLGEKLEDTGKIFRAAVLAVLGTGVRVGPFRDEYLAKFGVWLRGDALEVEEVMETLERDLKNRKIEFNALQWKGARERG